MNISKSIFLIPALFLSACASVTSDGLTQQIAVNTKPAGAVCELSNSRGSWSLVSPDIMTIRRDGEDLEVSCVKGKLKAEQSFKADSDPEGDKYGATSGLLGALIDIQTGAAYIYPKKIEMDLK